MMDASRTMLEKWCFDDGRAVEPTLGAGSSYLLKLSRGEQRAQALIEYLAPSTLTSVGIARQALTAYLRDAELPQRLIIGYDGKSQVARSAPSQRKI